MTVIKKTFQYGQHSVTLETGEVARQATGSVMVRMNEDTIVLVTVVGKKEADPSKDFLPLTINYQERTYAAGKIPGGFFKREGRPSERETLIARLIDRPLRPLFPKGFTNEVQVIATVLSVDADYESDIPALLGASAALAISGIPFNGPIGAARVGYRDGEYLLNPSQYDLDESALDLVVAGTEKAVLMVESEADELSEAVMLGAVTYGHEQMQIAIQAIQAFAAEAAKPAWDWQAPSKDEDLIQAVNSAIGQRLSESYQIADKMQRDEALSQVRKQALDTLCAADAATALDEAQVVAAIAALEKKTVRQGLLNGNARIDGRRIDEVRPISVQTGILPRAHGSALFTRGETQALAVVTLGTERDAQMIDAFGIEAKDNFIFHYNFPPYCVGEVGFLGSPKRREIGHGRLAKRGVAALLPDFESFPYVIRVVSEITESNGSSSMASVCGSSLALMDAGVPMLAPVAGIAMGLIKEGDQSLVLSDILGAEDHLGDMDFKVAGTADGITALQMDIKIEGITRDIMAQALEQARSGRFHILGIMNQALNQPRQEMSAFAPRISTMRIHPDKIRDVIGKGGATIREITEQTGVSIDIDDDGLIRIAAVDQAGAAEAMARIELITADVEVGKIYHGKVVKLADFGAFVNILPGRDGLVHISQISQERVEHVSDKLSEGEMVHVKVLEVDRQGRIRLSMKEVEMNESATA